MRAVEEIKQAVQYLKDNGAVKVGSIGFCMGGALSIAAAQHAGIDCAVPFYGIPTAELAQPENIKVPVALHTGALDDMKGFSDADTVRTMAEKINAAGGSAVAYIYEDCGHAFLNLGEEARGQRESMGIPHPPSSAPDLAWERVFTFLKEHLKQ